MNGFDPIYVAARRGLLDALEALGPQLDAVIVVGAQAVYMRTGDADLSVAPYTSDADLALAPCDLEDEPLLQDLLTDGGFARGTQPGSWLKSVPIQGRTVTIPVDVMVPEGLAPPGGRRGVRIPPHDKMAARKVLGLEGAVVDNDRITVGALEMTDERRFTVRVAGPGALLVAKLHKVQERLSGGRSDRTADKDAADIFRIMQVVPTARVVEAVERMLADAYAGPPTRSAIAHLRLLFGAPLSRGVVMAADALRGGAPMERVAAVCTAFADDMSRRFTSKAD